MTELILFSLSLMVLIKFVKKKQKFIILMINFFIFYLILKGLSVWGFMNFGFLGMSMGLDWISLNLVILSFWIIMLMLMTFKSKIYLNYYMYLLLIMLLDLIMFFGSMNFLLIYIFFEISIVPMYLLMMMWGYSSDRWSASYYLLIYTLFFSLPAFILIFLFFLIYGSLNMVLLMDLVGKDYMNLMFYFLLSLIFMVKIPLYFIHSWLPKAHVEAPLEGSMFLAGVLLKMGGYGLIRLFKMFMMMFNKNILFLIFSLLGMMVLSIQCLVQYDLKVLVAYSSVVHMGMVVCGICSMNMWGLFGGVILMLAHGLCSSGMFFLVNLNYEIFLSRSVLINKGMMVFFPSMSLMWFLIFSCNMSIPLSLNLIGELYLLMSLFYFCKYLIILMVFILFFSACYTLYMFSYTQHGGVLFSLSEILFKDLISNYLILMLHWLPMNLLMFNLMFMVG